MNQKTRYSDQELEVFDELIISKIDKAQAELQYYLSQIEDLAVADGVRGLEDATGAQESERLQSMASRQNKLILHLENARLRIKKKIYGVCRETGELISVQRLKAVPHATLSIKAKQAKGK